MTRRRTNRGVIIDLESLVSQSNPNQPAVGNMKVNARGDVLGKEGRIVKKNEERVREHYKNNPRTSSSQVSLKSGEEVKPKPKALEPDLVDQPDEFDAPEEVKPLGYKEVELENGDIQMVPYYREEDAE